MNLIASSADRRLPPRRVQAVASRGFTLIELLVTIALAAILTSLAAPSMTSMFRSNRVQTEASQLVGDLQYARTEAIKRGQSVSVCPSSDQSTCVAANTWQVGWLVFVDANSNGSRATTDTLLRIGKPFKGGDTGVAAPALTALTFNRDGFATMGGAAAMFKIHSADNNAKATRCVAVDLGGRLTTLLYGAASMTGGATTCS